VVRQRERGVVRQRERDSETERERQREVSTLTVRLEDLEGKSKSRILDGLFESEELLPVTELLDLPERLKNRKPPRIGVVSIDSSSPLEWIDESEDPLGKFDNSGGGELRADLIPI
jgi:hypothetical protein